MSTGLLQTPSFVMFLLGDAKGVLLRGESVLVPGGHSSIVTISKLSIDFSKQFFLLFLFTQQMHLRDEKNFFNPLKHLQPSIEGLFPLLFVESIVTKSLP